MRRGEIWWAKLPGPAGRRPVVLISRDEAYSVRTRATVVPLSTRVRGIPTEVRLGPSDRVDRACVANADEIGTIPMDLLERRIAPLRPEKLAALDRAIRFALGLE